MVRHKINFRIFIIGIIGSFISLIEIGCSDHFDHTNKYDPYYFREAALKVKLVQNYWVANGRPVSINLETLPWSDGTLIDFTNVITVSNHVYHCRFASRQDLPQPGLMAISDDGIILWINHHDGKIAVSPETNGVDRDARN